LLETNLELQRLTNSDGLTSLSNRRYFDEYLGAEWRPARTDQLALLMIDVDAFKGYNDTYGHVAGDEVLRRVAAVDPRELRAPGGPARALGGEEFSMILPATSPGGARLLAEKVRRAIETLRIPHACSPTGGFVTVSIGGAVIVPGGDADFSRLMRLPMRASIRPSVMDETR
jgi:two-component system chemotaxis family response regulator WspR